MKPAAMNEPLSGNLPGRSIIWRSEDGRTVLVRYCHDLFGLEHDGRDVMPEGSFKRIEAYLWAEFITDV